MEEKEQKRGRGGRGLLIKLGPEGCHCISPPAPESLPAVWLQATSERQRLQVSLLPSQLGALAPWLLEGSEAPDAVIRQQGLNVLVTALLRGVGHSAADAVAVFLSPMTAFRDEQGNQERYKNYTCPK